MKEQITYSVHPVRGDDKNGNPTKVYSEAVDMETQLGRDEWTIAFGLYRKDENGMSTHVADFINPEDAHRVAELLKEKL